MDKLVWLVSLLISRDYDNPLLCVTAETITHLRTHSLRHQLHRHWHQLDIHAQCCRTKPRNSRSEAQADGARSVGVSSDSIGFIPGSHSQMIPSNPWRKGRGR